MKKTLFVLGALLIANFAFANWSEPSVPPPGGNVPAPINVGITRQNKMNGTIGAGKFCINNSDTMCLGASSSGDGVNTTKFCLGNSCIDSWDDLKSTVNVWKTIINENGVSKIIGGNGIEITSTSGTGKGDVTVSLSDKPNPLSPSCTSGQILKYNGTDWVCGTDNSSPASVDTDTLDSVVGRGSVTDKPVRFNGIVGIGALNTVDAVIGGGLRIPTGAGVGKILTSDGSGNAVWQTPSTGSTGGAISGTADRIPKFNSSGNGLINSQISNTGDRVEIPGNFRAGYKIYNSPSAFYVSGDSRTVVVSGLFEYETENPPTSGYNKVLVGVGNTMVGYKKISQILEEEGISFGGGTTVTTPSAPVTISSYNQLPTGSIAGYGNTASGLFIAPFVSPGPSGNGQVGCKCETNWRCIIFGTYGGYPTFSCIKN